jgi:hypothetical protein
MHGNHPQTVACVLHACDPCRRSPGGKIGMDAQHAHSRSRVCPGAAPEPFTTRSPGLARNDNRGVDWTTWWPWRGAYTRSHPELGREIPQRPWYCVSRHGRVGRRQVFQSTPFVPGSPGDLHRFSRRSRGYHHHQRGVEQPGSSSGS